MMAAEEGRPRPHAELQPQLLGMDGHLSTTVSLEYLDPSFRWVICAILAELKSRMSSSACVRTFFEGDSGAEAARAQEGRRGRAGAGGGRF